MRDAVSILLVVSLVLASPGLLAQEDPHGSRTEAEQHYQTAVLLLSEGRYLDALNEFDAAIELSPQAIFYCNRALVLVKLKETGEAVKSLRLCRDNFEGDAAELAQIDAQYHGVEAYHAVVRPHSIIIAQDIASGPIAGARSDDAWNIADVGLISMGVGAAFLASALTVDVLSQTLADDFVRESEGGPGTSQTRYDQLKSDLEFRKAVFWGLAGAGAVFVAVGGTMVAYEFASDDGVVTLLPMLDGTSAGVQIFTQF